MALSVDQITLRERIAGLRGSLDEIQRLLWAAVRECREHVYAENGNFEAALANLEKAQS